MYKLILINIMEKSNNNKTYKAVVLNKFGENPKVEDINHHDLNDNELLVKMSYTSILPSDLFILQGQYGKKQPELPVVVGNEGSGVIQNVGAKVDKSMIGKHVCVLGTHANPDKAEYKPQGVWGEYTYTTKDYIVPFESKVDLKNVVNAFVNPLTACGFVDTVLKNNKKAFAHTGASSQLGRILIKLCSKENIVLINLVRKNESIEELKKLDGFNKETNFFVNTSEDKWEEKLKKLCEEKNVDILFDSVGGKITGKCLTAIKDNGVVYNYGNLSFEDLSDFYTKELIFNNKRLEGWWLKIWLESAGKETMGKYFGMIQKDLEKDNGKIFKTEYRTSYKFSDFEKAFKDYTEKGSGKVLIEF